MTTTETPEIVASVYQRITSRRDPLEWVITLKVEHQVRTERLPLPGEAPRADAEALAATITDDVRNRLADAMRLMAVR